MDSKTAKENDRRLFKYFNERDMIAVDQWINEHISKDFVNHSTHFGGPSDKNGLKEIFRKFAELDMTIELGEMVFEDDILCFRLIVHREHVTFAKSSESRRIGGLRPKYSHDS